jgi:hypothetical protein
MQEWTGGIDYPTRVSHLLSASGGLNDPYFLNNITVFNDSAVDNLFGEGDRDWFLASPGDFDDAIGEEIKTMIPYGPEMIVNGDFLQGNTGFTSQYFFSQADIGPAQTYALVHSPADARPNDHNGAEVIDHTTGTGLLMAVNGATIPDQIVWSQTLSLAPHSDFRFSLWIASWFPSQPASLDIRFNGMSIGTQTAPSTVGPWEEFSTNWNSGNNSSLTIEIIDTNMADIGSDFALDDISLKIL